MTEQNNNDKSSSQEGVGLPGGTRIGKYEIVARIGVGGQSVVYKARDQLLDRFVAIKQISAHLSADERFLKRFRAEAKILAQLGGEQSNIVSVYDLIEHPQGLFIAMEYVDGHSLREVLTYQKPALPVDATLEILISIATGLKVAHDAGIVHRDIKPGNVLVTRDHKARIMDFGVAAQAGQDDSLSLGTTKYMAPEVFTGATVDGRVDVYSLGFLAYEMLTGRDFFAKVFADVMCDPHTENLRWMKWHSDPTLEAPRLNEVNELVTPQVAEVVARMMAKDVARRHGTMDEVLVDLRTAMRGLIAPAEPPRPLIPPTGPAAAVEMATISDDVPTSVIPRKPISKRKKVIMIVAAAVMVIGVGIALAVSAGGRQRLRTDAARQAWSAAEGAYGTAAEAYRRGDVAEARSGFEGALGKYEGFIADFPDLRSGTSTARAWARMCQARVAMLDGATGEANKHLKAAQDMAALDGDTIGKLGDAIQLRADAVTFMDEMALAIEADNFQAAVTFQTRFNGLRSRPADQDLRAGALAAKLAAAQTDDQLRTALAACDAAMAGAEANAATGDPAKFGEARLDLDRAEAKIRQATHLADTPEVRSRVESLTQARRFVAARQAYVQTVVDGAPLSEQIVALEAVVGARLPTAALRDELAAARADQAYRHGVALAVSEDRADLEAARSVFEAAIGFKATDETVAALEQVNHRLQSLDLISQARRMVRNRQYDKAVELLIRAHAIRNDDEIAAELADAQVQLYLSNGDQARKQRLWPAALAEYEKARQVRLDDLELARTVERRAELTAGEKEYYELIAEGQALLAAGSFSKAVGRFARAERLTGELDVPSGEATAQRTRARYRWEISKADAAAESGDMKTALVYYRQAKRLIDTKEIRDLIREAEAKSQ